jgi:hypothetical protein
MDRWVLGQVYFQVVPFWSLNLISSLLSTHLFICQQCYIILEINNMVSIKKNYTLYLDLGGPFVVPRVGPVSLIVLYFRQNIKFSWFDYSLVDCVKYSL